MKMGESQHPRKKTQGLADDASAGDRMETDRMELRSDTGRLCTHCSSRHSYPSLFQLQCLWPDRGRWSAKERGQRRVAKADVQKYWFVGSVPYILKPASHRPTRFSYILPAA